MAAVYQIIEGIITTVLAKQYRSSFACKNGITNAFLCSFYRVATLGSGSGVAAIIYLGEQGIEYGGGFGLYMIQYALHKMSIALFSAILFVMNWEFMKSWFGDYAGLLAGGAVRPPTGSCSITRLSTSGIRSCGFSPVCRTI